METSATGVVREAYYAKLLYLCTRGSTATVIKVFIREVKQTTTTTATRTSPHKRFNEQNNSCARAL